MTDDKLLYQVKILLARQEKTIKTSNYKLSNGVLKLINQLKVN
jgi:hypothetical protein